MGSGTLRAASSGSNGQTGEGVARGTRRRPTKPPKYPQKQKSPTGNTNTYYTNDETIATKKIKGGERQLPVVLRRSVKPFPSW